ncbi:hypothetical protein A6F49_07900 [Enteractinococcus helveticum]|uniref:Uncharacterized protein n=1 Tax=Enteractinococcus helveticum TaxID=1837282 RepID=A0A1B7M0U7_9MICC|nr:hypothetical protein A6F49_07900 [Enteractinococcus helveticum]
MSSGAWCADKELSPVEALQGSQISIQVLAHADGYHLEVNHGVPARLFSVDESVARFTLVLWEIEIQFKSV